MKRKNLQGVLYKRFKIENKKKKPFTIDPSSSKVFSKSGLDQKKIL